MGISEQGAACMLFFMSGVALGAEQILVGGCMGAFALYYAIRFGRVRQ